MSDESKILENLVDDLLSRVKKLEELTNNIGENEKAIKSLESFYIGEVN